MFEFLLSPNVVQCPMTSKTWCNFLLASFGASSSSVMIHPLGVVSKGITLAVFILFANVHSSPHTECTCCVMGLAAIRGLPTSDCRDSTVRCLPSSWTRASVDPHPTQQTCQLSSTETSASAMLRDLSVPPVWSDSHSFLTDSMLRPVKLLHHQLSRLFFDPKVGTT